MSIALRHRDKLGPRDLILLEIWNPQAFSERTLNARQRMEVRERLAPRIPDRPDAWHLIGDAYFHGAAAAGYDFREALIRAENAFRRALALDPDITYIKRHLVDIANFSDDPFQHVPKLIDSLKLDTPDYLMNAAIMRGDSASVRRIVAGFPSLDIPTLLNTGFVAAVHGRARSEERRVGKVCG